VLLLHVLALLRKPLKIEPRELFLTDVVQADLPGCPAPKAGGAADPTGKAPTASAKASKAPKAAGNSTATETGAKKDKAAEASTSIISSKKPGATAPPPKVSGEAPKPLGCDPTKVCRIFFGDLYL
jgi:hypothetical protein